MIRTLAAMLMVGFTLVSGCSATLPPAPQRACRALSVGPGPEDFVVDTGGASPSLLVSTHDRRSWTTLGEVQRVDLATGRVVNLPRVGEPAGFPFRPHGLDLIRDTQGTQLLFVVVHGPEQNGAEHAVARYRVEPDRLVFLESFTAPLLVSPNEVAALPDGSFYVSNDFGSRGSKWELFWRLRASNVVYRSSRGAWSVAADDLAFANGLFIDGDRVFVSATRDDALFEFRRAAGGRLTDRRTVASIPGADNITTLGHELLITSHPDDFAFLAHTSDASKPSPTVVYSVGREGGRRAVFVDSGARASAAATAAYFDGHLYVGQAYNSGLLVCEAPDLARSAVGGR